MNLCRLVRLVCSPIAQIRGAFAAQRKMIRNYSITNQHCKSYTHICIYSYIYIYIYTELNILWPLLYLSTILSEKHIPWGWPPPASKLISNWCKLCLLEGGSGWSLLSSFLCVHKSYFPWVGQFHHPRHDVGQAKLQDTEAISATSRCTKYIWNYLKIFFGQLCTRRGDKRSIRPHQMDLCPVAKGKNSPNV